MRRLTAAERTVLRGYVDGETVGDMARAIEKPVGVVSGIISELCHHNRPQARSRLAMDDELVEREPQSPAAAGEAPPGDAEPSKTVHGVPPSITRSAYVGIIRAVGFDPDNLLRLEFRDNGIYAEVFARDPATGERLLDRWTNSAAIERLFVPIRDDQEKPRDRE